MKSRLVRRVLVALGIMVTLGAAAAESRACCLFRKSTTAYYAPVVAAPACNTCNYVPQVTYRSVFTSVPVTTYRPITTVNPCTGCPQTMVQPVTTYRMQPSLVPVTTYRPVAACYAPACPTGACGAPACATGACGAAAPVASTYYAPAYSAAPAAPACSSCTGAATYAPPAAPSTGVPSLSPLTPVPQPGYSSSLGTPTTFGPTTSADTAPLNRPIPDPNAAGRTTPSNTVVPPSSLPSDRQTARPREDRFTARPIQSNWYQPASLKVALPAEGKVEQVNWHAADR